MGLVMAGGLIVGLAVNLLHTQEQGRASLRGALDRRAQLTGRLISSAFFASNTPQSARTLFGGSPRSVARAVELQSAASGEHRLYVLGRDGRVIASATPSIASDRSLIARSPHLRAALAGRPALSDAIRDPGGRSIVEIAVPFVSRSGEKRVMVGAGPVTIVQNFAKGFFASASAIPGSRGYLLDGAGNTLSSMTPRGSGRTPPDRALRAALGRGSSGQSGAESFFTASVPSSRWRVVLSVPSARLYASVDGSPRRAAWLLFAAFSLAVCALLAFAYFAARGAQRLASATEREKVARQLAFERLHDPLTGLPTRGLFEDRAHHALAAARRSQRSVAVMFVDVDRFKRINDSLGHAAGDFVLRQIAERITTSLRAEDTVSRFGGDEFVLLCEHVDPDELARVADRLRLSLASPVHIEGRPLSVTVSIGVAVQPPDTLPVTAADLVRDADTAMYRAKGRGGSRVEVFDVELHQRAVARLDAEVALRKAIDEGELVVFYQPIVTLSDGRLQGAEALVRWRLPDTGQLVPPGDFIPLAEETGLISALGDWVLATAVRQVGDWRTEGLIDDDFELSVNVSALQLSDPGLTDKVAKALTGWNQPPDRLCLELTETAVMREPLAAEAMLVGLHRLGVRLAIDDFGVGHSSLGQLAGSLPISTLKLDRSFVAAMAEPRDHGIVQAVASLAKALTLSAVAEGVETPEQAAELSAMGFPRAQGFYFGRPVAAAEFVQLHPRMTTA